MNTMQIALLVMILLTAAGLALAVAVNQRQARRSRMLHVIAGQAALREDAGGADSKDKRRADLARKLKEKGQAEASRKKSGTIEQQLARAGMKIPVRRFWINAVLFAAALTLFCKFVFGWSWFVAVMVFVVGLFGVPRLVIRSRTRKRQKRFLEDFADALEAMVRLLKAGMPVGEAVAMASREFPGAIGEEMGKIYEAQKIGVPLAEAVREAAERMPLTEMYLFATGISIQAQTGASLSEVLMNLAGVIRSRFKLQRKVKALSAEAKASAMIIGSLPFIIGGGMYFLNPDYISIMFTTFTGKILLAGAAIWMGLGVICMKIMINFKV